MKRASCLVLAVVFCLPAVGLAKWHSLSGLKLKVNIPKDWKVESQGDVLTAAPASEEVGLLLWELGGVKSLKEAGDALDKELGKFVKDIKVTGDPEETEVNGLKMVFIDAQGYAQEELVELSVALVNNGRGKFLLVLGMAEPKAVKKYEKQLLGIVTSIKKS